jgi:hypothetical protein
MARLQKTSSGEGHPYLKGYRFWKDNRFWLNGSVTNKGVEYFEQSLEEMRNDKVLTRLTGGK